MGPNPPHWGPRDALVAMIRGALAKARTAERDGCITPAESRLIREALAAAVIEVQDARWRDPQPEAGLEVLGVVVGPPPAPEVQTLPTEPQHGSLAWWRGR